VLFERADVFKANCRWTADWARGNAEAAAEICAVMRRSRAVLMHNSRVAISRSRELLQARPKAQFR
jgi:hypothetical protein